MNEVVTEEVAEWLRAWGIPHVRINGDDIDRIDGLTLRLSPSGKVSCNIRGFEFDPSTIPVIWYRKWRHAHTVTSRMLAEDMGTKDPQDLTSLSHHLHRELRAVSFFFFHLFRNAIWLGNPWLAVPNKLEVLHRASLIGLDIPETLVTSDPARLRSFLAAHERIITKPTSDAILLSGGSTYLMSYTSEVKVGDITGSEWQGGFPSQVQELLDKEYELRIFYLDGEFFACALYTQDNPNLFIDSRIFDESSPAQVLRYELPPDVSQKLGRLMADLALDTCSIDMVKTRSGRYVFLEVNPVGQFEDLSYQGNFGLSRKIAQSLVARLARSKGANYAV